MKVIVSLTLVAAIASATPEDFLQYCSKFSKSYSTVEEFNRRMLEFYRTAVKIEQINSEGHRFTVGHNHMSDWTDFEYKRMLNV